MAVRAAIVVAVVSITAFVAVRRPQPVARPSVVRLPVALAPAPAPRHPAGVTVTFVPTDPTIVDRLRVDPAVPPRWRTIGDRELLNALTAAGQSAGLIRTDGRVILVPQ